MPDEIPVDVATIQNLEPGGDIRAKLNEVIARANQLKAALNFRSAEAVTFVYQTNAEDVAPYVDEIKLHLRDIGGDLSWVGPWVVGETIGTATLYYDDGTWHFEAENDDASYAWERVSEDPIGTYEAQFEGPNFTLSAISEKAFVNIQDGRVMSADGAGGWKTSAKADLVDGTIPTEQLPSPLPAIVSVRQGTTAQLDEIVLADGELAIERDGYGDPVGLRAGDGVASGGARVLGGSLIDTDSTIYAAPGDNLAEKYALAKALTPGGNALSRTNRATLVILPGTYTLSANLVFDANYVDVKGLGSAPRSPSVMLVGGFFRLEVSAWDVEVIGIHCISIVVESRGILEITGTASNNRITAPAHGLQTGDFVLFTVLNGGSGLATETRYYVQRIGNNTFQLRDRYNRTDITFSTDVSSGQLRVIGNTSQRFINCAVGTGSSFANPEGESTGTFVDCLAGGYSFGKTGAHGFYTGCHGGIKSFAGDGVSTASGIFIDCVGVNSFGSVLGDASGDFYRCLGVGSDSFAGENGGDGAITGRLFYCVKTSGTFQTVSGAGLTRYCVDGNDTANNQN